MEKFPARVDRITKTEYHHVVGHAIILKIISKMSHPEFFKIGA